MAFRCMFASLAVGVGTVSKLEDAQNAETNFYELLIGKKGEEFAGGHLRVLWLATHGKVTQVALATSLRC